MRSGGERRRLEVQLLAEVELLKGSLIFLDALRLCAAASTYFEGRPFL